MVWEYWKVYLAGKRWRAQINATPANYEYPMLVAGVDWEANVWVRAGPGKKTYYYKIGMRVIPVGGAFEGNFAVRCSDRTVVSWWKLPTPRVFRSLRPATHVIDVDTDDVVDLSSMD